MSTFFQPQPTTSDLNHKLANLRQAYRDKLGTRISAIESEANRLLRGDWSDAGAQRLQLLAHSLAGASDTFGLHALSQAACRLERILTPYLETPPLQKIDRIAIHRCVLEISYTAQDAQQESSANEALPWHNSNLAAPLIYIIESDAPVANDIATYLQQAGYQTRILHDADALLRSTAEPAQPQVIVMEMPCAAGTSAIAEYRAASQMDIPFIGIGLHSDIEARLGALRGGAARYLAKPLDLERLVRLLDDFTNYRVHDPYRILLVDNDSDFTEFSATVLRSAGMHVTEILDPLQALSIAEAYNPDVIVLDVKMPGISGIELAALLRDNDSFAHVPMLFLSSEIDIQQQLLALDLGGDEFLLKPIDPAHLVMAIRTRAKRSRHLQAAAHKLRRIVREKGYQEYALNQHAIVSIANTNGVITHVNDRFCAVSGYAAAELIGKNHRIVKSSEHPPSFYEAMWSTICAGNVWRGTICNRRKDGNLYWVESTIVPLLDENGLPYQYISIRTDVTQILHAESAIHAERQFTEAAINALPGIFYIISAENKFLRINENFSRITGYTAQEIESMTPLDFFDERDHEHMSGKIREAFTTGFANTEAALVTQCGVRLPFYFQGANIMIAGQPCLIGTGTDIGQLKQYEAALVLAKDEAECANRAKSVFLSNMSHELRTPMNAIMGFAQLAECDSTLSPDQLDNMQEILKAGRHLLELINEVLNLAQIESGRIELAIEAIACSELISECVRLIQPIADQQKISLDWQVQGPLVVQADRVRLKQALINLISNAVKYNSIHGKVTVLVELGVSDRLRFSVTDTGPGIPASRLADLFHPFQRLGAEQTQVEGTGIGLTICKHLIEAMDGSIGVTSTPGMGSTFWIELPQEECWPAIQDARKAISPVFSAK